MGKFHFFTNQDLLQNQISTQAFGEAGLININGIDFDQYRTTSLHKATLNSQVVSICDGTICVQSIIGQTDIVNIVLKPTEQPDCEFLPIQFIIFKGVLLSSLVDTLNMEINSIIASDLTTSIINSKIEWNKSYDEQMNNPVGTTTDKATSDALGLQYSASAAVPNQVLDTDIMQVLFTKENANFQLPSVKGGWTLGLFDKDNFGIEIILSSSFHQPIAKLSRVLENIIQVEVLPTSPSQFDEFDHWHKKEECLSFMDVAALYGSMFSVNVHALDSSSNKTKETGENIYNNLLTTFFNKNKAYIDIRNENGNSYNYMRNYSNSIQISYDPNITISSVLFYNKWPKLTFESTNVSVINSKISISIALPSGSIDENIQPLVFIVQGYSEKTFNKDSRIDERILKTVDIGGGYNQLNVLINSPGILQSQDLIAAHICINYYKQFNTNNNNISQDLVIRAHNKYDLKFKLNSTLHLNKIGYASSIILPELKLVELNNNITLAKVIYSEDSSTITLNAQAIYTEANLELEYQDLTAKVMNNTSTILNASYKKESAIVKRHIHNSTRDLALLDLYDNNGISNNLMLTIGKTELDSILNITDLLTEYPIYLSIVSIDVFEQDTYEKEPYMELIIKITGYHKPNAQSIEVKESIQDLKLISYGNI